MNTIEIGVDVEPPARDSMHVVSTAIALESRIESACHDGANHHARTLGRIRRIVLFGRLSSPAGAAALDALDALSDLAPVELADAVTQCVNRVARSRNGLPPTLDLCALRVDQRRVQWARMGSVTLLLRRRPSAWRTAVVKRISSGADPAADLAGGSVDLRPGDEFLAWVGPGAEDDFLAGLFDEPIVCRAAHRFAAGATGGCLATLKRC